MNRNMFIPIPKFVEVCFIV
uniref:Uncharacterized protein n=1 Tax=Anguilla anguilla TaxID=7936 RepID=A0A0E9PP49_ANGAN